MSPQDDDCFCLGHFGSFSCDFQCLVSDLDFSLQPKCHGKDILCLPGTAFFSDNKLPMLGFKYVQSHHAWLFPVFILQSQRENITQKSCCQKPNCWSLFFHYTLQITRCKMKNHIIYMLLLLKEANRKMFHWKCPFSENVAAFKLPQLRCVGFLLFGVRRLKPNGGTITQRENTPGSEMWIAPFPCRENGKVLTSPIWRLS